jgi:E3 SUMO-protein ligase PIAS1
MTAPHASAHLPPPGYAAATASSSAYRGIPASPPVAAPAGYSMAITSPSKPHIKFSPSPFYTVDQPASELLICPESRDSHDRKSITLTFSLTESQRTKLYSPPPGTVYQLRLYCTSSTYYTAPVFARTSQTICPIEFPPTCEVRVNTMVLNANLRGLKKKPGTAPPPDLGKLVSTRGPNKIEMIYLNSQMPGPPKVSLPEVFRIERPLSRFNRNTTCWSTSSK